MAETLAASRAGVEQENAALVDLSSNLLASLWRPTFPAADQVDAAADLLPGEACRREPREGPTWRISVSPGKVKIWTRDEADAERAENRQLDGHAAMVDAQASFIELDKDGERVIRDTPVPDASKRGVITGWSAKSRARMVERLCDLDYSVLFDDPSRLLAMLTLTYPGDWLRVAPSGRAVKNHLKRLRQRYERAYGEPLIAVWKLEFQRRGAPHVHLLIRPPHQLVDGRNFRDWVSRTWADVVGHPDPDEYERHVRAGTGLDFNEGLKASDPRRVAVYFTKHGAFQAKEYQHCVPAEWQEPGKGPGRFWGYWGLSPKVATRKVSPTIGTMAGRIVRRWSRAQQVTRQVSRPRAKGGVPVSKYPEVVGLAGAMFMRSRKITYRVTRVRAVRCHNGRGWISVNSGPDFAFELAAALRVQEAQRSGHRAPSGYRAWSQSLR